VPFLAGVIREKLSNNHNENENAEIIHRFLIHLRC